MADVIYQSGIEAIMKGQVDLDTDTLKLILVDSTYTPDPDHAVNTAINSKELSGTGYTGGHGGSGRKTIASVTVTRDDSNDRVIFDFADVTWTAINAGTVGAAVLLKPGTSDDTTAIPICCWDVSNLTTNGGDLTFQVNATGGFAL